MHAVIDDALEWVQTWESRWGERPAAPAVDPDRWAAAWDEFTTRMDGNFPFFHPRFAGQMLKPPHPAAAAGYVAAMLVNPNNHALDGGPVTSEMEKEAVAELAAMLGLAEPNLGHLTASGTIANLEALWVARELHPDKGVAYGANAHYTHARMCQVLRMPAHEVPADAHGRIDLDALDALCARGEIGTVVLTAGTTGLGAVDRDRRGARAARAPRRADPRRRGLRRLLRAARRRARRAARDRVGGLGGDRPAQAWPSAIRMRRRVVRRSGGRASVCARLAVHVLHVRRAAPGRDQPRVLARRCGRRRAVADAARGAARAGPRRRTPRGASPSPPGCASRRSCGCTSSPSSTSSPTCRPPRASRSSTPRARRSCARAWRTPTTRCSSAPCRSTAEHLHGVERDAPSARILRSVLMKPEHESATDWLATRVEQLAARTRQGG